MKYLLIYHERLGDIIQTMSIGQHLVDQGHQVWIECHQQYRSIFKLNPDLMPVYPEQNPPPGFKFDRVLNLQIWPTRYNRYRASKSKWWDFVISGFPDLSGATWSSPFRENLIPKSDFDDPSSVVVVAPDGFSQSPVIPKEKVINLAKKIWPHKRICVLNGNYRATCLTKLVALVRDAHDVLTINTSITYIADAVRESYHHVPETGHSGQNDFYSDKQTRHAL